MVTFSLELRGHQPVAPVDNASDELPLLLLGLEVVATPEDQHLLDDVLQTTVSPVDHAVLVRGAWVGPGVLHPILGTGRLLPGVHGTAPSVPQVVCGGRQVVSTRHTRYTSQFPQCPQQSLHRYTECLSEAHLSLAPPRVTQHEVAQQVPEGLSVYSDSQLTTVCEIHLRFSTRWVLLLKVHLTVRTVQYPVIADPGLKCPHL